MFGYLGVVEGSDEASEAVGVNLKAAEQHHHQDAAHTADVHTTGEGGGGGHTC